MKIFAPDYYGGFSCLMGECKHTCCAGWEIDIDGKTAEKYKSVAGDFGKKLRENIDFHEDGGSFRLCENDRCPFLSKENLCEIYINLGKEALSQVCDDHPRFRNFYESRTEIGFGLCCEAAAKMILEKETKTKIIEIDEDGEEAFFSPEEAEFFESREKLFALIQNREKPFAERISDALEEVGASGFEIDFNALAKECLSLERLDESWTDVLEKIAKNPSAPEIKDETAAEQLFCYFIFRFFSDGNRVLSLLFALLSFYMTEKAAEYVGIHEAARLWSSEIEYSDENTDILFDYIADEYGV